MLTLLGTPTARTTSHSVWPSATVPVTGCEVAAAAASADAFASVGPGGAIIPGHIPSELTRSSDVIGLSGVNGGAWMLWIESLPDRLNQSASRDSRSDENMSPMLAPEQPA